jgi:hypothetical protein
VRADRLLFAEWNMYSIVLRKGNKRSIQEWMDPRADTVPSGSMIGESGDGAA